MAAAVLLPGMTAPYLTSSTYPVRAGDNVLVHAAAGGTGALIVQLAVPADLESRRTTGKLLIIP